MQTDARRGGRRKLVWWSARLAGATLFLAVVGLLMIDPVGIAQVFGIALVAYWGGVTVLIWRHPQSPSRVDLALIRFGYLPVIVIAFLLSGSIWHLRGLV